MGEKDGQDDLAKKKKVGNYLLGKIIGEGAFAKVRQGLHVIAREKMAVKIVPKKAVLLRDYVKRSVRREAMLLQKLDHPNIVRLYEIMETENSYYLVLEYAEGGDFIKYLSEKKRLDEWESRKYIRQMASAVDHMHVSNITHRDLKLENLLLDRDYNIKIIDFGLSNVFYGDSSLNTQCGSPVYAAPEIFCNRKYGPSVDIWSMGICFYAMLNGKLPFVPEPANNITMLHTLIMRGPQIPDSLSDGCQNLISRMLAVDLYNRITMEDLLTHRWMLEDNEMPIVTRQPPIGKLYPTVPKTQIVNYMTTVFNFIEDDVFYSVMERKMNAVAATYHLLQKRFDAGINLVGISMGMKSAAEKEREENKNWHQRVEFPLLPPEGSAHGDNEVTGTKAKLKSYMQLLKDSKLRSAQNARSGSLIRQKEITLRRYKTRDIARHTQTREETSFFPDFILTYSPNDSGLSDTSPPKSKPVGKFEWEQTFIINKKDLSKIDSYEPVRNRALLRQTTGLKGNDADGRKTENADYPIPAPPTTPASPFIPREPSASGRSSARGERTTTDGAVSMNVTRRDDTENAKDNDSKGSTVDDPCTCNSWLTFQKQKTQLARVVTSMDKKNHHVAFHYGLPFTKPKTLTTREARSYFEEFEQTKVIGHGRTLIERSTTTASAKIEDIHALWGRKSRTAGSHRQLPDLRFSARSAHRPPTHDLAFRAVDANGILHFPDVTHTPLPIYDVRPVSPHKVTVEDGVTDVIKVHITSSAKY